MLAQDRWPGMRELAGTLADLDPGDEAWAAVCGCRGYGHCQG